MLRRLISRQVHLLRPLLPHPTPIPITSFSAIDTVHFRHLRVFSTSGRDGSDDPNDPWKISPESDELESSLFASIKEAAEEDPFVSDPADETKPSDVSDAWGTELTTESKNDVFSSLEKEAQTAAIPRMGGWDASGGFKQWSMGEDEQKDDLFASITNVETSLQQTGVDGIEEETKQEPELDVEELKRKEKELMKTLKGPNRAFGDLIAASGVTEGMIDSLILLKDVRDIPGLPPLKEIEDKAIANLEAYASQSNNNNNLEGQTAITRVKQVDDKGRSYATGRRKCSVARVWIQPGEGKFSVNEKEFDVYFPILDQRAELLRPFTVTDTLGKWDVRCTVKGGGTSGQVGAIRLGVSRALQNFEPAYRPYLKAVGYLTRDPRAVERKKPGKAKARKSFQWVKR